MNGTDQIHVCQRYLRDLEPLWKVHLVHYPPDLLQNSTLQNPFSHAVRSLIFAIVQTLTGWGGGVVRPVGKMSLLSPCHKSVRRVKKNSRFANVRTEQLVLRNMGKTADFYSLYRAGINLWQGLYMYTYMLYIHWSEICILCVKTHAVWRHETRSFNNKIKTWPSKTLKHKFNLWIMCFVLNWLGGFHAMDIIVRNNRFKMEILWSSLSIFVIRIRCSLDNRPIFIIHLQTMRASTFT